MKKIYETWRCGWEYLFSDELSTYYTFFTMILAECALLWCHAEKIVAFPFTLLLIACILNVIICAALKGAFEELWVSILYISVFAILIALGCKINPIISIIMIGIPFIVTLVSTLIQEWLYSCIVSDTNIESIIILVIHAIPYIVFIIFLAQIQSLPILLKVIIPIIYFVCIPFMPIYEDNAATNNIFELAYESDWHIIKMWFIKNKKNRKH